MLSKRNYTLDLLKIIAMNMVIIEHMLIYTNIKSLYITSDVFLALYSSVRVICIVNVNIFIICSGVILYERPFKFKNVFKIILHTVIVSIVSLGLYVFLFKKSIKYIWILKSLLPVLSNSFWFITSYLGLYLLHPILDIIFNLFYSKKRNVLTTLILYFIIYIYPNCFIFDSSSNGGGTIIWMIILYFFALSIRNIKVNTVIIKIIYFTLFFILTFVTFISLKFNKTNLLLCNESPLVLMLSISFFLMLKNTSLNFENKLIERILVILSSSTLMVYLIHENCCKYILWDYVNHIIEIFPITIIFLPIIIYIAGIFLNFIVGIITKPILKLSFLEKICKKIDLTYERL